MRDPPRALGGGATPEAAALLAWYDRSRRDLPWRAAPGQPVDPYRVWLSEIMLQQTTVQAVRPYFEKFLTLWPDARALARADESRVLAAWAGLGYYSRARNLIACARLVEDRHGGRFPDDEAALRALPGIGAYTAAAIAAIAFGRRAVVVDGNVERVVARYFAIPEPLPGARARIRAAADSLTPDRRCGDFAQGMMDLGATICTPRNPACALCPLTETCAGRIAGLAASLPAKIRKPERPTRRGGAFVIVDPDGRLLVGTRAARGLLGGMTEVPGTEWRLDAPPLVAAADAPFPAHWRPMGTIRHVFTHFSLDLAVFRADVAARAAPEGMRWIAGDALDEAGLPTVMRKAIARAGISPAAPSAGGTPRGANRSV